MFKLSKKADYGLIAVKHLAMHRQEHAAAPTKSPKSMAFPQRSWPKCFKSWRIIPWYPPSMVPAAAISSPRTFADQRGSM